MKTKMNKKVMATMALAIALVSGGFGAVTLEKASAETTKTQAFEMLYGASIRLADVTGLRFQVKLGQQEYETITASENVRLGMMILPVDYVNAYNTAKAADDTLTYHTYFADKTIWNNVIDEGKIFEKSDLKEEQQADYEEGYYYASGVISEVLFNNYNRNFIAVAYQETTDENSNVTYTYTAQSEARSVAYVAGAAYEKQDWDDYKSTVENFIDYSVYNLAGVKQNAETKEYTYSEQSYASFEEVKAAAGEISITATTESDVLLAGKTQTATASLKVGDTEITADIKYGVADNTAATVSENGVVTALKTNATTNVTASAFGGKYLAETPLTVSDGNIFTRAEGWRSGGAVGMALTAERANAYAESSGSQTYNDAGYFFNKARTETYTDEAGNEQTKTITYWHEDEQAFVFYKLDKWSTGGSGAVRYFLIDSTDPTVAGKVIASPALRALLEAGTQYVKFDVKVDETFMSMTLDQTSSGATPAQMNIRMGWSSNTNYTTNTGEATGMEQCIFMAGQYVTVAVDISAMLTAYEAGNVNYVWFFLGGNTASEICFKNFAPITEDEYYAINNPFSYMGGGKAQALSTYDADGALVSSDNMAKLWDKEEGAFTVILNSGYYIANNDCIRFNVNNGTNIASAINFVEQLSAIQEKDGKAYIKFDVKVDETYVNNTGKWGNYFTFWVRCATTSLNSQIGPKADASNLKANEWTTLYCDAAKLLEYYHNESDYLMYFQFTMYGPAGAKISFRNLQAATEAEYTASLDTNS